MQGFQNSACYWVGHFSGQSYFTFKIITPQDKLSIVLDIFVASLWKSFYQRGAGTKFRTVFNGSTSGHISECAL